MTIVAEVRDALQLIASVVKDTRTIVEAIRDGQKYLERYHPDAKQDLRALLDEIQKSVSGLARASRVLTGFQFTVSGAARDLEPREFNNYVVASQVDLQDARDQRENLKASCRKVVEHRDALNARAGGDWLGWVGFIGEKRQERRQELAMKLDHIYSVDEDIVRYLEQMLDAVEVALKEVSKALAGDDPSGGAHPENVPSAQQVLSEYAAAFEPIDRECRNLVGELRQAITALA